MEVLAAGGAQGLRPTSSIQELPSMYYSTDLKKERKKEGVADYSNSNSNPLQKNYLSTLHSKQFLTAVLVYMGHTDDYMGTVHYVWALERPNSGSMCVGNMLG